MAALSRSLVVLAATCASVDGARVATPKMIAGVRVHNHDQAFKRDRWEQSYLESVDAQELDVDKEHWIAKVKKGVSEAELFRMCSAHVECEVHGSTRGFAFVEFTASAAQLGKILAQEGRNIEFVEPNMPVYAVPEMDSVESEVPWGIRRIRSRALSDMPASDPGQPDGGAGVNVYVLDTGVRTTHEEFGGRAQQGMYIKGLWKVVECSSSSAPADCSEDDQGHGTHCAGTIAGSTYGVAKGAAVIAVKVLSASGGGTSMGIANGMDWVATNAVFPAVASMSLGGSYSASSNAGVESMTDAGVTVVTASGNSNADGCGFSPGSAPTAINVGSLDADDGRSYFSNFGSCLDIWAPGRDILSSVHTSDDASATYSGTSMACPHVSGVAALILQNSPHLTPAGVTQEILSTATYGLVTDPQPGSPNVMLYTAV